MKHTHVISSHVVSVGYDEGEKLLEVRYSGDKLYRFLGVPVEHWHGLLSARSKGAYIAEHIRGKYDFTRDP